MQKEIVLFIVISLAWFCVVLAWIMQIISVTGLVRSIYHFGIFNYRVFGVLISDTLACFHLVWPL